MVILTDSEIKQPDESTIIWRYMSLDKFILMVFRKEIFFPRAFLLKDIDKYEGVPHDACISDLARQINNELATIQEIKASVDEKQLKQEIQNMTLGLNMVSCWHAGNEHESYAMWKIYGDRGIAISTTYGKLKALISKSKFNLYIGAINYDLPPQTIKKPYLNLFSKSKCFDSEKEIRIVVHEYQEAFGHDMSKAYKPENLPNEIKCGRWLGSGIHKEISKVYLAPKLSEDLRDYLEKLLRWQQWDSQVYLSAL